MKLNLPILEQLKDSSNILIAGAGGGFDIFCGLPLYFTLREQGKQVHLANFSSTEFGIFPAISKPEVLINGLLLGAHSKIELNYPYYPEGYLAKWFQETRGETITVWMFARSGVMPLTQAYGTLVEHLKIDAIVLVDGGVDSLMRADELGSGTLVEDSISLAAIDHLNVPVKLLVCLGFGTEVEESLCHYTALENMAGLIKAGGFLGSCSLTPQMEAFQLFEAACRYVWEQPKHPKSHISTRVIPAAKGEFGNYHMYPEEKTSLFISPLMSIYWFFDACTVIEHNLLIPKIMQTITTTQAIMICLSYKSDLKLRPRRMIPY